MRLSPCRESSSGPAGEFYRCLIFITRTILNLAYISGLFVIILNKPPMPENTSRLSELSIGQSAIIDSFSDDYMKLKLLEMGCLPGEMVSVDRVAPFGDPIAIKVADSTLSIRLSDAYNVLVVPVK